MIIDTYLAQMALKVKLGWLRYVESIRKVSIVDNYSSYFSKSEAIPLGMERVYFPGNL